MGAASSRDCAPQKTFAAGSRSHKKASNPPLLSNSMSKNDRPHSRTSNHLPNSHLTSHIPHRNSPLRTARVPLLVGQPYFQHTETAHAFYHVLFRWGFQLTNEAISEVFTGQTLQFFSIFQGTAKGILADSAIPYHGTSFFRFSFPLVDRMIVQIGSAKIIDFYEPV